MKKIQFKNKEEEKFWREVYLTALSEIRYEFG
jgi:hypothetical protein